jgi:hypothetical protein
METDPAMNSTKRVEEQPVDDLGFRLDRVTPNPEFIYRLRRRLITQPTVILEQKHGAIAMLLVGFGLLAGALILWFLRRFR